MQEPNTPQDNNTTITTPLKTHNTQTQRTKPAKNIQILACLILVYQLGLLFGVSQGWLHFTLNRSNSIGFALFCLSFDFMAAICLLKNLRTKAWVLLSLSTLPVVLLLTLGLIFLPQVAPEYRAHMGLIVLSYFLGLLLSSWKLIVLWLLTRYNRKHMIEDEEGNLLAITQAQKPIEPVYFSPHALTEAATEENYSLSSYLSPCEVELKRDKERKKNQQIIRIDE